jgi:probable HAF family extracellular repeat protein
MTDLGALPSPLSTYSQAFGINDRGQVIGESGFRDAEGHPFFWSNGVMTDVGTLGGPHGFALAINNQGQVVGGADTTIPDPANPGGVLAHAFLWTPGHMQDLGSTADEPYSEAHAINNRGQIVGLGCCAGNNLRALLWQDGRVLDLNTLIPATSGWYLVGAGGINDRGQIVGGGINPQGQFHAFLVSPSQGHGPGVDAQGEAALAARAHAALARLPAAIGRHLGLHRSGGDGA